MVMQELAIIIPVLDDARTLERLLRIIRGWNTQPGEIVVVMGSRTPEVEQLCSKHDCRILRSRPCRGAQLDDGARFSEAPTLWFLHADAVPAATSLETIARARAGGAEAGCFRFRFTGRHRWQKRWIERLVALRLRCGGIPYGDQGLWIDRKAYRDCGGFEREPLFEEVRLVRRLKSRHRFIVLDEAIGVSSRRWVRDGWLTRSIANRLLAFGHALGIPAARLAARYYPPAGITGEHGP